MSKFGFVLFGVVLLARISYCEALDNGYPPTMPGSREEVYKKVDQVELKLYILEPAGHKASDRRAAIVFFFGGGWSHGSPEQFLPQARHLAKLGMVAMVADYRVKIRHQVKMKDCVTDAQSAIRWVRKNADRLGIDPKRIAAGGGSAGGHLAACTGTVPELEVESGKKKCSSQANAMVLFNPALILAPVEEELPKHWQQRFAGMEQKAGIEPERISPYHQIRKDLPPTLIMHGKNDVTVPYRTAELFRDAMVNSGNRCKLIGYEDAGHGFFNTGKNYTLTLAEMTAFLKELGYLKGKPTR